ncbi:MAG: hypothetical protein NC210_01125 [[Clostridium] fimetarium]|nr:hypothetical protein [Alistipes timonensis]MCM1405006.1 hypothetical protein [[Clostridium] fimetarium]
MRHLLIALLAFASAFGTVYANKRFVEMEYHKNRIKLDDGTNNKPQVLKDETGTELKFKSLVGALNYMTLQGWELVDTKSVTSGSGHVGAYGGSSSTGTKVYYIFQKETADTELSEIVNKSFKD